MLIRIIIVVSKILYHKSFYNSTTTLFFLTIFSSVLSSSKIISISSNTFLVILFKSYEYIKHLETDINDLQERLQYNYNRFVYFKRYIVEPALKEINRETDLNVTVEYIKVGKTYKKIKFYIKNKYGFSKVKQLQL